MIAHAQVARFRFLANPEHAEREFVQPFSVKEVPEGIHGVRIESGKPIWICTVMGSFGLVASNGKTRRRIKLSSVKLNGEELNTADKRRSRLMKVISLQKSDVLTTEFSPKNS